MSHTLQTPWYKKPRYVQFVKSLPRTGTGAIDRVQVKALYGGS